MSARRAGLIPSVIDRFGDVDLRETCAECLQFANLREIPRLMLEFGQIPWLYGGPLENHPSLIAAGAAVAPLLGNAADDVRRVRDPWRLAEVLREEGLLCPEVRRPGDVAADEAWLWKPLRSAGGAGITRGSPPPAASRHPRDWYLQRFVAGTPWGVTFVGNGREAVLVGAAEQFLGEPWTGARDFQYCGSIGPVRLVDDLRQRLSRLGGCLAARFQLRGLFGVDVVVTEQQVWVIEVNPRYTASVEVLERAGGMSALAWHWAACCDGELPGNLHVSADVRSSLGERGPDQLHQDSGTNLWASAARSTCMHGKAIVFAEVPLLVDPSHQAKLLTLRQDPSLPELADIPAAGVVVEPGQPLLTVFSQGQNRGDVLLGLHRTIKHVRETWF